MIKKKEILLLQELRRNARAGIAEISTSTRIPKSTVFDKLRKLEESVIKKHVSIIDFEKLGFTSRYLFLVKVDDSSRKETKDFLMHHPSVNNVHITNSDFDFLFEGIFSNSKEMEDFKKDLESKNYILMTRHHELIEDIAREKFMEVRE